MTAWGAPRPLLFHDFVNFTVLSLWLGADAAALRTALQAIELARQMDKKKLTKAMRKMLGYPLFCFFLPPPPDPFTCEVETESTFAFLAAAEKNLGDDGVS